MKNKRSIFFSTVMILFTVIFLSGCQSDAVVSPNQASTGNTTVSMRMGDAPNHNPAVLQVREGKMLFSDIMLKSSIASTTVPLTVNPVVGVMNLDNRENTVLVGEVPQGTYNMLSLSLKNASTSFRDLDPDFIDPLTKEHYTVVIRGSFGNNDFIYKSKVNFIKELQFTNAISLAAGQPVKITLIVTPDVWFTWDNGTVIDPNVPDNWKKIDENIQNSIIGVRVQY